MNHKAALIREVEILTGSIPVLEGTSKLKRAQERDVEKLRMLNEMVSKARRDVLENTVFETYVKSKDIDIWHVIVNGDYKPTTTNLVTGKDEAISYDKLKDEHKKMLSKNDEAKMVLYNALPKNEYERIFMCKTARDVWNSLVITHQGNKQVNDNKIDLFVQEYKQFIIFDDETIDCAFARFNTIVTSFKALDESFSSRNHVRKFLRALPTKWRLKVTAIKESKDLSTLLLDELIGNLKVYEVVLEKDSEASKSKNKKYKSLALKAKKVSSDEEVSFLYNDHEEYAIAVRDFKKFFRRIDYKKDKKALGFTEDKASTSGVKTGKMGQESTKMPSVEPARTVPSEKVRLRVKLEPDEWIKDSGCLRHMRDNKDIFSTYEAINGGNGVFGSNTKSKIISKGLWYPKGTGVETIVYADSDHAGDYVDRKRTSGVCTFMGCCLTSWFSKKQTALAISTTKTEYVSTGKACQQALWMKQDLVDFDIKLDDIPILCDNKGAIDLMNPLSSSLPLQRFSPPSDYQTTPSSTPLNSSPTTTPIAPPRFSSSELLNTPKPTPLTLTSPPLIPTQPSKQSSLLTINIEPVELIFSTPPTSPHIFFDSFEDLSPRTVNRLPP
ncbi:hypothetical protein Tco_0687416 [Tanacetum coccineum]